ncbi:MAG: hypothetical protein EBR07_13305, partial [Planctomycetes bacterium]|nr:hypothetical protein [Planctomycetota bacterium]
MEQTAAHLVYHVFPHLSVRQWVLSVPKRLRYFMQRDGAAQNSALRIFLRVIGQCLLRQFPGAAKLDKASVQIGAVAFIHRFGSSLNTHVHFHICAIDGVFEALWGDITADPATGFVYVATKERVVRISPLNVLRTGVRTAFADAIKTGGNQKLLVAANAGTGLSHNDNTYVPLADVNSSKYGAGGAGTLLAGGISAAQVGEYTDVAIVKAK